EGGGEAWHNAALWPALRQTLLFGAAGAVLTVLALPSLLLCLATAALTLGVPLLTLGHWLWEGGGEAWHNAALWPALRQTLLFGAAGAVLTVLA
uniref:hypothetical protein n=1 Tax=Aquitalea magnusonii TaxID=332411 RepID=UPI00195E2727